MATLHPSLSNCRIQQSLYPRDFVNQLLYRYDFYTFLGYLPGAGFSGAWEEGFGLLEGTVGAGLADTTGGLADATGGLADATGGLADATGGLEDATGGLADATGGFEDCTGGL